MKVTILVENISTSNLLCEHGLSLFIEYNNKYYLLDAGQSEIFIKNAKILNVPLDKVEFAVLSHGHYDHSGGFYELLKINPETKIFAMTDTMNEYYSASGGMHPIGVPSKILQMYKDNFELLNSTAKLDTGVYVVPHSTKNLEKIGERTGLYKTVDGELVPDDFSHELSLVFETEKGLVVFNSCSHGGILNIISEVKSVFKNKDIYAFIGGLHMKGTKNGEECCTFSKDEVCIIAKSLEDMNLKKLYTGHCTGEKGFELLSIFMGDRVEPINTGKTIVI